VRAELDRFVSQPCRRLNIEGPQLSLLPSAAQTIAMALHELATNACKYGALSDNGGTLQVSWRLTDDAQKRFVLVWSERTGSPIETPTRAGFGTKLIRDVPVAALDADVQLTYTEYGVCWSVNAPAESVVNFGRPAMRG
jgi:two-component sensor histidine kinase